MTWLWAHPTASYTECGKQFGISRQRVGAIAKRAGIKASWVRR